MSKQIDGHKPGRYELVPVGELIPYVNNARTHSDGQIVKLQASIREFGFVNPVKHEAVHPSRIALLAGLRVGSPF